MVEPTPWATPRENKTPPDLERCAAGRIWRLPGVYAPQADSYFLSAVMRREGIGPGMDVLDVCTGSGVLALEAARLGARVTAVDVSRRAVVSARLNALAARVPVTVLRGDLLTGLSPGSFDVVVSNPPYVPAPDAQLPRRGARRAWDAGLDGRILLDRICEQAPGVLRPGGRLLMVHSALCDPDETARRLTQAGLAAEVCDRLSIPFGPVMTARIRWLRENGLVPAGINTEELVVVRAHRD
ncbi:HemK2/MTQ2 family protein methyltransferase [Streptomyces cyaneofuscatus]|uniref:HemK2/MTQ2 family protein methyltransferase n=1 Tax=Streptomyces cyaneofuscatus TaxID=66883 RepID=UPI00369B6AA1